LEDKNSYFECFQIRKELILQLNIKSVMANIEIVVPKLGESVIEATITRWLKQVGEQVFVDEPVVEIATDKVDSEITATVAGKLSRQLFPEGSSVAVGQAFAIVETDSSEIKSASESLPAQPADGPTCRAEPTIAALSSDPAFAIKETTEPEHDHFSPGNPRFYSPLVRSIALQENIPFSELDNIPGTGMDDRLTKHDLLRYIEQKKKQPVPEVVPDLQPSVAPSTPVHTAPPVPVNVTGESRIIEMDRIRQLISSHMVRSVQTSPHVTSFMEVDMSNIVSWREKSKDAFQKRENEKLTFTPVFIEAIAKTIRDFPMVNVSVDGTRIIVHKGIHVGMAVALADFNLIVPVIKHAGEKNLLGIVKNVNDLAERARKGKLLPDEISGGTISLTNLGSFGTLMGTPIINQPQTAIIAVGAIKKRVVVIETDHGDQMAIRPIMMISVTYDHRVIDGALGGRFLSRLVRYLEQFDPNQAI
jgi:2-oxoglutarate dehydrogenase E2 component (dihydrolipoamide succinyltransferase)